MKKKLVHDLLGLAECWERDQTKSFGPERFGSWLQVLHYERQPRPGSVDDVLGVLESGPRNRDRWASWLAGEGARARAT